MNVTIDLPKQTSAALEAQARAAQMPTDRYLGPGPTEEGIDESRREMFRDFGASSFADRAG